MKLNNGKNIILDSDVTVSNGGSLSEILNKHESELDKLKSNVKWLYKYGGSGSGVGGGGSDTSSKWYILVDINGTSYLATSNDSGEISTGELIVNGLGNYKINIKVLRPGGSSFSSQVSWFNGTSTNTVRKSLNSENSWSITLDMYLGGNNTISVQVTDNEYTATLNVSYITSPYIFNLELADADGNNPKVSGSDIFIGDIEEAGLKAKFSYDIGIEVAEDSEGNKNGVTYTITDILGNIKESKTLDLSKGNKGFIMLDLVDDPNFLLDDNNSATYTYYLTVNVETKGGGTSSTENFELSFNLIPTSLFLKIIPDKGTIYLSLQNDPAYVYFTGAKSFSITPFYGNNTGKTIVVNISVDGILLIANTSIRERNTLTGVTLDINNTEENTEEHILEFNASYGNVSKKFTYYLYAKQLNSNLKWYPIDNNSVLQEPVKKNYWRNVTDKTFSLTSSSALLMTSQSEEVIINLEKGTTTGVPNNPRDFLFAAGILYSEINSLQHPIISLHCNGNNSGESYINIYYDKVTLSSSIEGSEQSIDCYINKTPYNEFVINSKNYHLFLVYKRLLKSDDVLKTRYYEIAVYIDGVLERTFSTWSQYELGYDQIILHPSNYYINLLELSYFNHTLTDLRTYDWMNDANIVRYWYTYQTLKLEVLNLNTEILGLFENNVELLLDIDYYNLPITDSGTLKLIAENSEVPILKFQYEEDGSVPFLDWFTNCNYGENDIIPSKQVSVQYSQGKSDFNNVNVNGCLFYIDIQGSTTRKYRGKNLELSLKNTFEGDTDTYIFSPNFEEGNYQTFLPESSFTLKADAVDSSHSNNTTMGDFINKNTLRFADASLQGSRYGNYIKNCLIGFPILVFIDVKQSNGISTTYYLGIYNFNLGRKSFFNLGYIDTNVLETISDVEDNTVGLKEGFHVYRIQLEQTNKINTFLSAEITGNDAKYDFSLYDSSLLVRDKNNEKDLYAMFDDIETGIISLDELTQVLLNVVKDVAKAGHYIFKSIGKNFGEYEEGYSSVLEDGTSKNQVPNYKILYRREIDLNGNSTFIPKDEEIPDGNENDLDVLINTFNTLGITNSIDYQSLVEYYTICMIFGLFDSVQKNLNIKTWNKTKFYLAFYDMDTCLGVDNAGNDSDYFAFSDYWDSSYKTLEINGREVLRPSVVNIYRDFSPESNHGFDIPSSYLFAVAKYSKIFENRLTHEEGASIDLTFPARLWANWRRSDGELRNSEYFIEHYYKHHLNGVNELMFNYNYRSKYFVLDLDDLGNSLNRYDTANHGKFKGRRLEYVRQWLDGRFHLLDAYFNLPRSLNPLTKLDLNTGEWTKVIYDNSELFEPSVLSDEVDITNTDIYVINSIFGNLARFNNSIDLIVKSSSYSPLFLIPSGGNAEKMLLKDSNAYYNIYSERVGLNNINLGGSSSWTELDSINCFLGSLTLQSDLLSNLNGDKGSISNWSINLPSVKNISLTSPDYSGVLSLNSNTPDLTSVNISNSKISLNLDNKPSLKTIIANSCKGVTLNVSNCNNIENVMLSGTFGEINIDGIPIDINLNAIKSSSIRMTAGKPDLAFSLINDSTITKLELSGFKSVNVLNCNKLKEVIISGDNTESITITSSDSKNSLTKVDLNIRNCTNLNLSNNSDLEVLNLTKDNKVTVLDLHNTSINKIIWNGEENNEYLDLSYFLKVTDLNIQNNSNVEYIQFRNDKDNPFIITRPFSNCTKLKRVYGNLLINTQQCFYNLRYFSIHGSNPTTYKGISIYDGNRLIPIYELFGDNTNSLPVSDNLYQSGTKVTNISFITTNASYTYYGTNYTTFDIYYTFYNLGNATNLAYMFCNATNEDGFNWNDNVDNSPNRYMFNKARNVTNVRSMFWRSGYGKRIKIFSPTDTEIGLLTPLTSVTDMDLMFGSYEYIIDRNVFKSDIPFNVTSLLYFEPVLIVDDINNLTYIPEISIGNIKDYLERYGNISTFFNSLLKVVNINGLFNGTLYINYNNEAFHIPNSVTSIKDAFVSRYGNGALKFADYFSEGSNLKLLQGSFIVLNELDIDLLFNSINSKVTLEITSDMFNKLSKLTHIGYDENGGDFASYYNSATFSGGGLKKSLKDEEFPYSITHNLPNLQLFSGVFSGIKTINTLTLPGLMFESNSELTDISAAFYNLYANIELTANGFINCPKLSKASYLFLKDLLPDGNENLNYSIFTTIPYKFFYHGSVTNNITIQGCYERDVQVNEEGEYTYPEVPLTITFQVETPLSTITNLNYCFGGNDINYYTDEFRDDDIENNPDYNPFDYIFRNNKWVKNTNKDTRRYLFYWKYNGMQNIDRYSPEDYVILDEMKVDRATEDSDYKLSNFSSIAGTGANVMNFFCSPDLLRYSTANCNITGLFYLCGKYGSNIYTPGGSLYQALREWGIKGRICPYLLKPVSGILNLSYFMKDCKGLSNYELNGEFYFIPKTFFTYTPNVNNLTYAFSNTFFAENTKLDGIFSSLKSSLIVLGIFFRCLFPLNVFNVFSDNDISNTRYAFAVSYEVSGDITPRFYDLTISFSNIFKDYTNKVNNLNYLYTFNGYSTTSVLHEVPKTLSDKELDYNYTTI